MPLPSGGKFSPLRSRRVLSAIPALFDTTLLRDDGILQVVISDVDSLLGRPDVDVEGVVAELVESPTKALELVLASVSKSTFDRVVSVISANFPFAPETFASSVAHSLLTRLPIFFLFLPNARSLDLAWLSQQRTLTETTISALQVLNRLRLSNAVYDGEEDIDGSGDAVKRKSKNRHKRKQSRAQNPFVSDADRKTILSLPEADFVPSTKEGAMDLCSSYALRFISFKELLKMLRRDGLSAVITNAYYSLPTSEAVDGALEEEYENGAPYPSPAPFVVDGTSAVPEDLPPVLPMKAALYFDSADGFGEWRVLISTRADRDLRQARKRDAKMFAIYVKKIKELSNGHFSDDNQKRLTGLDVDIPIYEAKMTGDTRLVYQVDCIPEFQSPVERQVLRIFGIYTHTQLDRRLWSCMSQHIDRRGAEYRKRCTFRNRPVNRGDNVYAPACWPPVEPTPIEPVSGLAEMRKEDLEEIHSLLVLEKFVTFSQALLNSILADQEVAHVFNVTPQEQKIIEHPSSCYVLGRSGTGKTTTMLFKMLGMERAWESHRDVMPKPRQLFVTQSRVLAEKVEEYFVKLLESLATAGHSHTELVEIAARKKRQQEQGLVDRDEEIYWRGDLPQRYGELKDEHFPMFVTYDHICRLLENDLNHHIVANVERASGLRALDSALSVQGSESHDKGLSNDYMQQQRASFVSFGTFIEEYWSHFPQALTRGLDPTLVFGEFMGVIKGSELALDKPDGYLDEDTYLKLSHRTQGTFANQRECIYRLFAAYVKRKKERGDYDAADRTHALINAMRTHGVPGLPINFIYVDEAQDNLLIDALILRKLCRNPHGLFWAGDTAQTISVGSAFRFDDLKAFLYRYEKMNSKVDAPPQTPESFHLAINYRSHGGIVNCAHSVILLITQFWPHAIDALGQETGMIDGLKPVFFHGWDQNTVRYEQFLFGESGNHIEFGAEQCILVRDEAARDKLRAQVGDIGLIMTLYESKGLEFNDVLLYNFFEDSTVDLSQWRVVLNALPPESRVNHPAPRFDDVRHSGVCRDLKFLYVAITRARKNLWIADGSEKGEPMRIVWSSRNQIQSCTPGSDVPKLAMSSTPEDWAKTALSLFNNRRYMQAMHCYERAGLTREKAVAHAYHLRELARSTPVTRGESTAKAAAFVKAADAFVSSATAAVTEKKAYYRIAGECFVAGGDDVKAAQAYRSAEEYTLAAQHFRRAGKFDDAIDVIQSHKGLVAAAVADSILGVSKLYFLREKQIKKARALFETDEEALEYMDDFGLDIARASLLEDMGKFADAADVHFAEGNVLEAIRLLSLDIHNASSTKRAFEFLLGGLWQRLSLGVHVSQEELKGSSTTAKLLRLAENLERAVTDEETRNEVLMFIAISRHDYPALAALVSKFVAVKNKPAVLLCMDHLFSIPLKLHNASLREIADKLHVFMVYTQNLGLLLGKQTPCESADVRKVLAILPFSEDVFVLPPNSLLAPQCTPRSTPNFRVIDQGISVPRWELDRLINVVLEARLLDAITEENKLCHNLRPLHPCLPFVAHGQCNRAECARQHTFAKDNDVATYHFRIRVVLLQIIIYHGLRTCEQKPEFAKSQLHWLRELHDAIFPAHYKLGGLHIFNAKLIPEFRQGVTISRLWAEALLYELRPHIGSPHLFLTKLLRSVRLTLLFNAPAASVTISRIPAVALFRPPHLLRNDNCYVVQDAIGFMHNNDKTALSRGVLFINHVVSRRVACDVNILCDLMDTVVSCLIISTRLQSTATLHNVTLPKSWLFKIMPRIEFLRTAETPMSKFYLRNLMAELLEQIYSGIQSEHFLFENRDLATLAHPYRNVIFLRICKNLCLWGYNMGRFAIKNEVTRAINSVRRPSRIFHSSIEPYVAAKNWDRLARLVRHSAADSSFDEMIQLHHTATPITSPPLPGVRRIVYGDLEDLPWFLQRVVLEPQPPNPRVDTLPSIPATTPADASNPDGPDGAEAAAEPEANEEEIAAPDETGEAPDEHDVETIAQAIAAEDRAPAVSMAPTAQEVDAAAKIASAYRRHMARSRVPKLSKARQRWQRIFDKYAAHARTVDWPRAHYRMLFLGPVPHLASAVETMKDHLYETRSTLRKKLNIAKHLELETMGSTLTRMNALFKTSDRLHKDLAPTAVVHQERDIAKLKALALAVEELMQSLPASATQECEKDMRLAMRGIVAVPKPPKKPTKPELNVCTDDHLDDGVDDGIEGYAESNGPYNDESPNYDERNEAYEYFRDKYGDYDDYDI
ncbi:uncharacterized protein BXZ73DRAFT_104875 [Epithele typhae]|uniref:uncharacterized protein n=1 Tax=Epithele typhae TaxID=378194 RepID=UPI0020084924|nr:uncharacterized protein BXZ73DRAFT_104875 [Epithele typhae]KAH9919767.1 hypothetical protein BXZ73DRAFT_104875 [Epithele typhae]